LFYYITIFNKELKGRVLKNKLGIDLWAKKGARAGLIQSSQLPKGVRNGKKAALC
jgi:hypothetical protein